MLVAIGRGGQPRGSRRSRADPRPGSRRSRFSFSRPAPTASALPHPRLGLRGDRGSTPRRRPASARRTRPTATRRRPARCPFSVSTHSMISRALPTARPSGASMLVSSASVRTPAASPMATSDCASAPRVLARLHERAVAGLHVEHEPADALGDLLAHDRRGDQRNALDGAGHVAQRVELAVGRRDLRRLADQRAADRRDRPPQLVERQARCGTRESIRACRACRRCGRGRGPTSSAQARRTRPPAAPG